MYDYLLINTFTHIAIAEKVFIYNHMTIYAVISAINLFYFNILYDWFIYLCSLFIIITLPFFLNIFHSFSWNCYCFIFILICFFACSIFVSVAFFSCLCLCVLRIRLHFCICLIFPSPFLNLIAFAFCHFCKIWFLVSIIDIDFVTRK